MRERAGSVFSWRTINALRKWLEASKSRGRVMCSSSIHGPCLRPNMVSHTHMGVCTGVCVRVCASLSDPIKKVLVLKWESVRYCDTGTIRTRMKHSLLPWMSIGTLSRECAAHPRTRPDHRYSAHDVRVVRGYTQSLSLRPPPFARWHCGPACASLARTNATARRPARSVLL